MRNKLPVVIENFDLPRDESREKEEESRGYASVLFLLSLIVVCWSVLTIILLGRWQNERKYIRKIWGEFNC